MIWIDAEFPKNHTSSCRDLSIREPNGPLWPKKTVGVVYRTKSSPVPEASTPQPALQKLKTWTGLAGMWDHLPSPPSCLWLIRAPAAKAVLVRWGATRQLHATRREPRAPGVQRDTAQQWTSGIRGSVGFEIQAKYCSLALMSALYT